MKSRGGESARDLTTFMQHVHSVGVDPLRVLKRDPILKLNSCSTHVRRDGRTTESSTYGLDYRSARHFGNESR